MEYFPFSLLGNCSWIALVGRPDRSTLYNSSRVITRVVALEGTFKMVMDCAVRSDDRSMASHTL